MNAKIYHNPKCSKSRETLKLLNDNGAEVEVIEYLKTPPIESELNNILNMLGISARELVRTGEKIFKENYANRENSDEELIHAMVENPIFIQRPIVVVGNRAVIGRPQENILTIIK
jgi:arsenate reductase (glutaredoxin)